MAYNFPQGFNITSAEPVDARLVLTKEQMKNTVKASMPEAYFCICSEDKQLYIYDKSISKANADLSETGRFIKFQQIDTPDISALSEEEISDICQ